MCIKTCLLLLLPAGPVLEIRIRNWLAVLLKMDIFRLLISVPIENVQEIWPTKMDFGRSNAEIGWKMANG